MAPFFFLRPCQPARDLRSVSLFPLDFFSEPSNFGPCDARRVPLVAMEPVELAATGEDEVDLGGWMEESESVLAA